MKVSVLQENLTHGLSIVARAVAARSTLPVLKNILIATDEGRLRLSATDLELGITCWIGAKVEEEGSTTVPARAFSDLVSTLPSEEVLMDLIEETQTLNVVCGATITDLKCIDSQEFPPMPVPGKEAGISINATDLRDIIKQVAFSAATDEARPVLTGVQLLVKENHLTMAAADGFRLSVREADISTPAPSPIQVIIPAKALNELARISSDGNQIASIVLPPGRRQVIFRVDDIEVVSQLIEGNFPDYNQIIPKEHSTRTVVATSTFLRACRRAEIFAREGSLIARLIITPGDEDSPGTVLISGESEETGSNETSVDASIEGPGLTIAFNVRYMRDVLEVIHTQHVALQTINESSPGVILPVGVDDYQHIIMPMYLGG